MMFLAVLSKYHHLEIIDLCLSGFKYEMAGHVCLAIFLTNLII